jgi:DNA-binding transcriptional ArsR family regulator
MLELVFTVPDLSQLRFAYSPLWELVVSFRVLFSPARHALHAPWISEARRAIAHSELAGSPDLALMRSLVPPTGYIPDFLTPPPTTPLPSLDDEIALLLETPGSVIRHDLGPVGMPPYRHRPRADMEDSVGAFYDQPRRTLRRLVGTLRAYWDLVLAHHWQRMRTVLDSDLSYRTGRLARGGQTEVFADLHPQIEWADGVLRIHKKYATRVELAGRGLVLVPSVMGWPSAMFMPPPWQPTLIYPARGVATLWETGKAAPDGLARLLGETRANLMVALGGPASTGDLARLLSVTPAAISQHIGVLRDAGLVTTDRRGRNALHMRTQIADALVTAGRIDYP